MLVQETADVFVETFIETSFLVVLRPSDLYDLVVIFVDVDRMRHCRNHLVVCKYESRDVYAHAFTQVSVNKSTIVPCLLVVPFPVKDSFLIVPILVFFWQTNFTHMTVFYIFPCTLF